ncbi:DHHC palmitoyltransferase-domain-containing protein [Paraphysoderma sedebokerense]|nr:DHHC palmitoyltransferase-domain-containing protein [Paraphysoderma sedebokerense]
MAVFRVHIRFYLLRGYPSENEQRRIRQLTGLIRSLFRKLLGVRIVNGISRSFHCLCNTKHPLLQILFIVLLTGGVGIFMLDCYSQIPNEFVPYYHRYIVPTAILIVYGTFMAACRKDPGTVTTRNLGKVLNVYKYDGILFGTSECRTCRLQKPARSKHCSLCNKCVARHDHHCAWINNCVGHSNHPYFILFLVSVIAICVYGAYLLFGIFLNEMHELKWLYPRFNQTTPRSTPLIVTCYNGTIMIFKALMNWDWMLVLDIVDEVTKELLGFDVKWRIGMGGRFQMIDVSFFRGFLMIILQPSNNRPCFLFLLLVVCAIVVYFFTLYHLYVNVIKGMTTNENLKWDDVRDLVKQGGIEFAWVEAGQGRGWWSIIEYDESGNVVRVVNGKKDEVGEIGQNNSGVNPASAKSTSASSTGESNPRKRKSKGKKKSQSNTADEYLESEERTTPAPSIGERVRNRNVPPNYYNEGIWGNLKQILWPERI